MSTFELYQSLISKLGEEHAKVLVEYVDAKIHDEVTATKAQMSSKEDVLRLETRMAEMKADLIKWMVGFWIAQMAAIIGLYLRG